jgi:hypothetical protein
VHRKSRRGWILRWLSAFIAGTLSTIVIAWWFAIAPQRFIVFPASWSQTHLLQMNRLKNFNDPDRLQHWYRFRNPGTDAVLAYNRPRDDFGSHTKLISQYDTAAQPLELPGWTTTDGLIGSHRIVWDELYGWPIPCLRKLGLKPIHLSFQSTYFNERSVIILPDWATEFVRGTYTGVPIGIMPARLVLNVAIHAFIWRLLAAAAIRGPRWIRSRGRRSRNRCPACGYPLDDLTSGTCPECGEPARAGTLSA